MVDLLQQNRYFVYDFIGFLMMSGTCMKFASMHSKIPLGEVNNAEINSSHPYLYNRSTFFVYQKRFEFRGFDEINLVLSAINLICLMHQTRKTRSYGSSNPLHYILFYDRIWFDFRALQTHKS